MATQELQHPEQTVVERNTHRIDKLIHDIEMLVQLLEDQRLVDPTHLVGIKRDLYAIKHEA